jgi:glycosyltransferase involved in cell wall biosynthesis
MPALNEAANIEAAVEGVLRVVDELGIDTELLVLTCVDARGCSDGTVDIARRLAAEDRRVRSIHSPRYQRLGEKFRHAIVLASKTYFVMVPGDNEFDPTSIAQVFARLGEADLIICHASNPEVRPWRRRILSRTYTLLANIMFGYHLRYYNGMNIYRAADLKRLPPLSDSFALGVESVVLLLRAGRSRLEVPVRIQPRLGVSKAFRWDNASRVVWEILTLRWRLFFSSGRRVGAAEERR